MDSETKWSWTNTLTQLHPHSTNLTPNLIWLWWLQVKSTRVYPGMKIVSHHVLPLSCYLSLWPWSCNPCPASGWQVWYPCGSTCANSKTTMTPMISWSSCAQPICLWRVTASLQPHPHPKMFPCHTHLQTRWFGISKCHPRVVWSNEWSFRLTWVTWYTWIHSKYCWCSCHFQFPFWLIFSLLTWDCLTHWCTGTLFHMNQIRLIWRLWRKKLKMFLYPVSIVSWHFLISPIFV